MTVMTWAAENVPPDWGCSDTVTVWPDWFTAKYITCVGLLADNVTGHVVWADPPPPNCPLELVEKKA